MTELAIFDLDNCILNTRAMPKLIVAPLVAAVDALRLDLVRKERFKEALWTMPYMAAVAHCGIPEGVSWEVYRAYEHVEVPEGVTLETYGDLAHVVALPVRKVLVTSGFKRLQLSKIRALKIEELFEEVIVDEISVERKNGDKRSVFERVLHARGVPSSRAAAIGDSGVSELLAGKALGMKTVQTLRPHVKRWPDADHHISSFAELEDILCVQ